MQYVLLLHSIQKCLHGEHLYTVVSSTIFVSVAVVVASVTICVDPRNAVVAFAADCVDVVMLTTGTVILVVAAVSVTLMAVSMVVVMVAPVVMAVGDPVLTVVVFVSTSSR